MKKSKRILALIAALLLVCLYGSTFVFAFFNTSVSLNLLKVSVALTILLPVLLYAYAMLYRLLKNRHSEQSDSNPHSDIQ